MSKSCNSEEERVDAGTDKHTMHQEPAAIWARLISEVRQAIDGTLPPESEEAQALAWRWMRLYQESSESNPALFATLRDMQERNITLEFNGITAEMLAWIALASAHARVSLFAKHLLPNECEEVRRRQVAHVSDWPPMVAAMRKLHESKIRLFRRWRASGWIYSGPRTVARIGDLRARFTLRISVSRI